MLILAKWRAVRWSKQNGTMMMMIPIYSLSLSLLYVCMVSPLGRLIDWLLIRPSQDGPKSKSVTRSSTNKHVEKIPENSSSPKNHKITSIDEYRIEKHCNYTVIRWFHYSILEVKMHLKEITQSVLRKNKSQKSRLNLKQQIRSIMRCKRTNFTMLVYPWEKWATNKNKRGQLKYIKKLLKSLSSFVFQWKWQRSDN